MPDEGTHSRFKKALTKHQDEINITVAKVTAEFRDELERLRADGIAPPL